MTVDGLTVTPVILSGGSGSRLWPLSTPQKPKQFLPLTASETMIGLTIARTTGLPNAGRPMVVASAAHAGLLDEQLVDGELVVLEPCARNTAPAIALAALLVDDPATALLIMPSDHRIGDVPAFHAAIARALPLVAEGWLMTLGIAPDAPETGYGYIALGDELAPGVQRVASFVEKPDRARAEAMLAEGNHVWNAGIFLFRADAYLDAMARHCPDMLAQARAAVSDGTTVGHSFRPDAAAFARCPSDSIDYAIMERADRVGCVPVEMDWSDVGSWDALHAISVLDTDGNAVGGSATLIDSGRCLVRSDGPHVTLVGVEDLIVVVAGNEVMIVPRGQSQLVKKAAEAAGARAA